MKEILNKIEIRLNTNYRRSIGGAPIEFTKGINYFDVNQKQSVKIRPDKSVRHGNITCKKIPVGTQVFIKNFLGKKTDDAFIGPYIIKDISKNGKWYKVSRLKEWIHVDHLKC